MQRKFRKQQQVEASILTMRGPGTQHLIDTRQHRGKMLSVSMACRRMI
jgi:hypothetical protein